MTNPPHYIYGLIDPRDKTLFYIGMTYQPSKRLTEHKACNDDNPEKSDLIRDIRDAGFEPEMVILQTCPGLVANHIEKQWIGFSGFLGAKLLNRTNLSKDGFDIQNKYLGYSQAKLQHKVIKESNLTIKQKIMTLLDKLEI